MQDAVGLDGVFISAVSNQLSAISKNK